MGERHGEWRSRSRDEGNRNRDRQPQHDGPGDDFPACPLHRYAIKRRIARRRAEYRTKQKKIAKQLSQRGRQSTILTEPGGYGLG